MEGTLKYRVLMIDGSISNKLFYKINDQGSKVLLKSMADSQEIHVHKNRLIPVEKTDVAICIVSGGNEMVICPRCQSISNRDHGVSEFTCVSGCGTYQYHNLGSKSREVRSSKIMSLNNKNLFDIEAIKQYPSMAVLSKINKFNNPSIDSRSVVIVHTSDKPRKLQFNTYNGSLGKKAAALPLEDFNNNIQREGQRCPWTALASAQAEIDRLKAMGYEQLI